MTWSFKVVNSDEDFNMILEQLSNKSSNINLKSRLKKNECTPGQNLNLERELIEAIHPRQHMLSGLNAD